MAIDLASVAHSRRTMLGAALGAVAATVAQMIGRPPSAGATNGDTMTVGGAFSATSPTELHNLDDTDDVFRATSNYGTSVKGYSWQGTGVHGDTSYGTGIYGSVGYAGLTPGHGVLGESTAEYGETTGVLGRVSNAESYGVRGETTATELTARAIVGKASAGTAVLGYSGTGSIPAGLARTGVYGRATQSTGSRGVYGLSTAGRGVYGQATTGFGVRGYATTGAALYGQTSGLKDGAALHTIGRVQFDNCVGHATIAGGTKSKVVTPGIALTSSSVVVATLQGGAGGTTTVHRVVVDAANDRFTVYLTAKASANVKVAWHAFG